MDNYKGIFYNETKDQNYYEGGAHFRYKDLYEMLSILGGILPEKECDKDSSFNNNNINKNDDNYLNLSKKKEKNRTRNFNQFNFVNNPNTQLTFNKQNILKNNSIKNIVNINSRNNQNINIYLGEPNINYNRTNTTIYKFNQNNIRNNLIQTILNKKGNNLNKEQKNNEKYNSFKDYLFNNNKYFNRKKKLNQIISYNIQSNNLKNTYIINSYNNNSNKLLNIQKDKKEFNYLNDKFSLFFSKNNEKMNSRNLANQIIIGYRKSSDNFQHLKYKDNNINNIILKKENNIIRNMKNFSSGLNVNNNMNKTMNKKLIINGNSIPINKFGNKNDVNINKINNDLLSHKYYRKKIHQIFDYNQNMSIKNKKKSISRNFNNMNNIYNSQNIKFRTTYDVKNFNNL